MGGSLTAYNVKITDDASIVSRTSEVLQCINSLESQCVERWRNSHSLRIPLKRQAVDCTDLIFSLYSLFKIIGKSLLLIGRSCLDRIYRKAAIDEGRSKIHYALEILESFVCCCFFMQSEFSSIFLIEHSIPKGSFAVRNGFVSYLYVI